MPFIDTHCHLDFPSFQTDFSEVIKKCRDASVERIIIPGVNHASWQHQLSLSSNLVLLKHALGIHPCFLDDFAEEDIHVLDSQLKLHPALVAVGEIGLDKFADHIELQKKVFEAQLILARKYEKPVILHVRKMHNEVLSKLKQHNFNFGGVVHAFSGGFELAESYLQRGFKLGIGGVITYPRANKTRDTVSKLPLESIVLETDAPDMPLNGFQGKRNEPANIRKVFDELCSLRAESPEEIERTIYQSSISLFG